MIQISREKGRGKNKCIVFLRWFRRGSLITWHVAVEENIALAREFVQKYFVYPLYKIPTTCLYCFKTILQFFFSSFTHFCKEISSASDLVSRMIAGNPFILREIPTIRLVDNALKSQLIKGCNLTGSLFLFQGFLNEPFVANG